MNDSGTHQLLPPDGAAMHRLARLATDWEPEYLTLPMAERRQALSDFAAAAAEAVWPRSLMLAFGSVGRGEPAQDVDLLVILDSPETYRVYHRFPFGGHHWDVNVATSEWLRAAHRDLEWGYCLTEATCLFSGSEKLEALWRRSVALYGSASNKKDRLERALAQIRELERAAPPRADLASRLYAVEALRLAASTVIGVCGGSAFSRPSYVKELEDACERIGLSAATAQQWVNGLVRVTSAPARDYESFRLRLSAALRSAGTGAVAYDPSQTLPERLRWLKSCAADGSLNGLPQAAQLADSLPDSGEITLASRAALAGLQNALSRLQTHVRRGGGRRRSPDRSSGLPGLRWREERGQRLKVILSGSGCSTPWCVFCELPSYATNAPFSVQLEGLEMALDSFQGSSLSLYNDGSFLSPHELPARWRRAMLESIRNRGIAELRIESTPRHITRRRIEAVFRQSGAEVVYIGLGFQAAGDWFSMSRLGRPDSDFAFRQAVETIHDAGARARLYLLWGYPAFTIEEWVSALERSLLWAERFEVDLVSICPYTSTDPDAHADEESLCALRHELYRHRALTTQIECLVDSVSSCGAVQVCLGCGNCTEALRNSTWMEPPGCSHGNHPQRTHVSEPGGGNER